MSNVKDLHLIIIFSQFECSSPPMENGNTAELCNGGVRMGLLKLDDVLSKCTQSAKYD